MFKNSLPNESFDQFEINVDVWKTSISLFLFFFFPPREKSAGKKTTSPRWLIRIKKNEGRRENDLSTESVPVINLRKARWSIEADPSILARFPSPAIQTLMKTTRSVCTFIIRRSNNNRIIACASIDKRNGSMPGHVVFANAFRSSE